MKKIIVLMLSLFTALHTSSGWKTGMEHVAAEDTKTSRFSIQDMEAGRGVGSKEPVSILEDEVVTCVKEDLISKTGITMKYIPREEIRLASDLKTEKMGQKYRFSSNTPYFSNGVSGEDFLNDCSTNYGFSTLDNETNSEGLEKFYMDILNLLTPFYSRPEDVAASDFEGESRYCIGSIDYIQYGLNHEEVFSVYQCVLYDHPLFFYADNVFAYDGQMVYLLVDEDFAQGAVRMEYAQQIQSAIKSFEASVTDASSNYEIAKRIHDAIIDTADYAYEEDGITPQNNIFVHSIAGYVSGEHKLVCDGYAKTYAAALNYLDIENIFVTGWRVPQDSGDYTESDAHAWNMVKLGTGEYYFVDVTWDDTAEGAKDSFFCIGSEIYDTHTINITGTSSSVNYQYILPECADKKFTGEDRIAKTVDPEYVVMNTVDYTFADGVLTFSGKGSIQTNDDWNKNSWYPLKDQVKKLVFADGITFIGACAFYEFDKVESIEFPSEMRGIDGHAFYGCTSLTEVTLPDQLSYIGGCIFASCTSLKKVTYGTVTADKTQGTMYTGGNFDECSNLETIIVSEDHCFYKAVDNVLYRKIGEKWGDRLEFYPEGKRDVVFRIPDEADWIGSGAFTHNQFLHTIEIPEGVKYISPHAISYCGELESITFPSSIISFAGNPEASQDDAVYGTIFQCPKLAYIENLSSEKIYFPSCEERMDSNGEMKYFYWKDADTQKVVGTLSCGKVVPSYERSFIYDKDMMALYDGINYFVTDLFLENGAPPTPEQVAADMVIGTVIAIESVEPDTEVQMLPDTICVNGWYYTVDKEHSNLITGGGQKPTEEENSQQERTEGENPQQELTEVENPQQERTEEENSQQERTEEETPQQEKTEEEIPEQERTEEASSEQGRTEEEIPEQGRTEEEIPEQGRTEEAIPEQGRTEEEIPEQGRTEEAIPEQEHTTERQSTTGQQNATEQEHTTERQSTTGQQNATEWEHTTEQQSTTERQTTEIQSEPQAGKTTETVSELPAVGATVTVSSGTYRITASSKKQKEVTFIKPKNAARTSINIPASIKIDGETYRVTEIAPKAFRNNKKLKSVTMGKYITKIGNEAFSGCRNLKKITIKSSSLKTVGKNTIKQINKKAVIKVPKKQLDEYKKLFAGKTGYKKTMTIKK